MNELIPRAPEGSRFWRSFSLIALGGGVFCLTAAVVLLALRTGGYFDRVVYSEPDTGTAFNISSILSSGTPLAAPSKPSQDGPPVVRLLVPKIGVDANVVVKGVDAAGVMQVPGNAYDVAWYDFASRPGGGGNIVFSGHVDYHGVGPAVFWNLGKLQQDDEIDLRLSDGAVYRYRVIGKTAVDATTAPIDQIVGPTDVESLTLITCTGTFNAATHQYDRRLVVRAERLEDGAAPSGVLPAP